MPSPQTAPQPRPASDDARGPRTDRVPGAALRTLLAVGVAVTALSGLALIGALASYFLGVTLAYLPVLYGLSLFGLPLGFTLMVLHMVVSAVRRSRV